MSDFVYTDSVDGRNSSAVEEAWYNVYDKTLLVALVESEKSYLYSGVPSWVWSQLKGAPSLGSFYATTVKRNYGPGNALGWTDDLDIVEYGVPAANMGSVTPIHGVGTPKGLTLAPNASVTTKAEAFPLSVVSDSKPVLLKHEVIFTSTGSENERLYVTEAENIDDATSQLDEVAEMLDLNFTVKRVTVHFE